MSNNSIEGTAWIPTGAAVNLITLLAEALRDTRRDGQVELKIKTDDNRRGPRVEFTVNDLRPSLFLRWEA